MVGPLPTPPHIKIHIESYFHERQPPSQITHKIRDCGGVNARFMQRISDVQIAFNLRGFSMKLGHERSKKNTVK